MLKDQAKSSVLSLLWKADSDGDAGTNCGKLFQTDAAFAGKAWLPMVAREEEECNC